MKGSRRKQAADAFEALRRQKFRRYFQPSRIVLGVVEAPVPSGVNVITLCFVTHCSYKPPMMAVAIHRVNWSYELFRTSSEFVLAVPGEGMADETLRCGLMSGRHEDKVTTCGLELIGSKTVGVPSLAGCIANMEFEVVTRVTAGDHLTVIGHARRYAVRRGTRERELLSVGPAHEGYEVLAQHGIHRIAVPMRREAERARSAPASPGSDT